MGETRHTRVLIIGSGPAGYTAAVYAARAMLNPILVQGLQPGGQLTITTEVENWPGDTHVQGPDLMVRMQAHAEAMGAEVISDYITALDLSKRPFTASGRQRHDLYGGCGDPCHRRASQMAGPAERREVQGLRRFGLRDLRRVLLPRQGSGRRSAAAIRRWKRRCS